MTEANDRHYFLELLIKAYEGQINPNEVRILNECIKTDDQAACLYAEFFDTVSGLVDISEMSLSFNDDDSEGLDRWINCLAQDEKSAPAVDIPKEKLQNEMNPLVISPKSPHRVNKMSLSFAILNAAALLFIILFIRFAPDRTGKKVATLTGSLNAKWAIMDTSMEIGTRLLSDGSQLLLRKGLVELRFDTNARVVLEGPAEFQILAEDRIGLRSGKIYATIPPEGIGFSIYTQNAKVVDLGTEFGVQTDLDGDTYLHVIKGKTTLIAGEKTGKKSSMEVNRGCAKKVSGNTSEISEIACDDRLFVRTFDSDENIVWKGQNLIDLADVVGGGNGFGIEISGAGINPTTGRIVTEDVQNHSATNQYVPVPSTAFIDGVFVPDGKQEQIITTAGHRFSECPVTQSQYYSNILNTPSQINGLPLYQENTNLAVKESPCIFLHANLGITFDLNAFRKSLPETKIRQFQTTIGISDSVERFHKADFWVLVDGQLRYRNVGVETTGLWDSVTIEITDADRFLTLVSTDGGPSPIDVNDPEYERSWIGCDWCIFSKPSLILE